MPDYSKYDKTRLSMLLRAENNKKINYERLIQKQGKSASPGLLSGYENIKNAISIITQILSQKNSYLICLRHCYSIKIGNVL